MEPLIRIDFYNKIAVLLKLARNNVVQAVNKTMVYTYFEIGRMIVEEEQGGEKRAKYGKKLLKELSERLIAEFGRGFSVSNLQQMKNFYLVYGKQQALSVDSEVHRDKDVKFNLSWSHYLLLMRIENTDERKFYEIEVLKNQ